jgi:hypothetical protein
VNGTRDDEDTAMERSKLEAFDFVIRMLKDHERHLDLQLERLEAFVDSLSSLVLRLECVCDELLRERGEEP